MRRSLLWPAAVLLAAITGALIAATTQLLTAPVIDRSHATGGDAAVRAFYEGINDLLVSGDVSALENAVSSDYVDHGTPPGLPPNRDGLERLLLNLRSVYPTLRVVVDDVYSLGDRAVAQVQLRGAMHGEFLGFAPGLLGIPFGPIDLFQVQAGRVVARWGTPASLSLEPIGSTALDSLAGTPRFLALTRWTFPTGTQLDATLGDGRNDIIVESGKMTVLIGGSTTARLSVPTGTTEEPGTIPAKTALKLTAGHVLTAKSRTTIHLANESSTAAVIIIARFTSPGNGVVVTARQEPDFAPSPINVEADGDTTFPGGITLRPIATSPLFVLPATPSSIAIGRVTLAPGADFPSQIAAGPIFVAVEAGEATLETGDGQVLIQHAASVAGNEETSPTLRTGDGAFIPAETSVGLRNDGTTTTSVLILAIVPMSTAVPTDPV